MLEFTRSKIHGPYLGAFGERILKRRNLEFRIFGFAAYDTGIVGSEYNGIAVFCEAPRIVCLDKEAQMPSSYSPGFEQTVLSRLVELEGLPADDFLRFVAGHPRVWPAAKDLCLKALGELPRPKRWTSRQRLKELIRFMENPMLTSYNLENKKSFSQHAMTLARSFLRAAGLSSKQITVSFNQGGIAVSGEVYVKVEDEVVMEITCSMFGHAMLRCTRRRDHGNRYLPATALLAEKNAVGFSELKEFIQNAIESKSTCKVS